jgi:hypothetical protein
MNSYKSHFDHLGERIQAETKHSYLLELFDALIVAMLFALPFIVYFADM